jgi:cysteine synthase A
MLGAEVHAVPAVPFEDPQNYNHRTLSPQLVSEDSRPHTEAKRFADKLDNAVWTNQFDNRANRQAHIETTGPEILAQLNGKLDGFTCASGTGGTLAGVTRVLKDTNPKIKVFLADPPGSVLHSYVQSGGKLKEREGGSITEGIGQGRVTDNLKSEIGLMDDSMNIPDADSIRMVYQMLDREGLYLGASSALNVAAAAEMGKRLGKGSTVVTILCDAAYRYQSRLFSRKWLESKKLLDAIPAELTKYIVLE